MTIYSFYSPFSYTDTICKTGHFLSLPILCPKRQGVLMVVLVTKLADSKNQIKKEPKMKLLEWKFFTEIKNFCETP